MSMDEHDDKAVDGLINFFTEQVKQYKPQSKQAMADNEHIQVILQCAAKFPELRFGQFLMNAVSGSQAPYYDQTLGGRMFYIPDRDLANHCKSFCKEMGR